MTPTDRRPPFRFSTHTRVGFDETDAQGIVYYGRYMPYFDRARVEYLRHLELLHRAPHGPEFVATFCELAEVVMGPEVAHVLRVVYAKEGVR